MNYIKISECGLEIKSLLGSSNVKSGLGTTGNPNQRFSLVISGVEMARMEMKISSPGTKKVSWLLYWFMGLQRATVHTKICSISVALAFHGDGDS